MKQKVDWIIHLIANGVCNVCGKKENGFLPNLCNAHTHGMEKYGHPDFQLVLALPIREIGRILNELGFRVRAGERFKAGDMVSGIFEDCHVRLDEFEESERKVLRVMIPDACNRFPEEEQCGDPYKLQLLKTEQLHRGGEMPS